MLFFRYTMSRSWILMSVCAKCFQHITVDIFAHFFVVGDTCNLLEVTNSGRVAAGLSIHLSVCAQNLKYILCHKYISLGSEVAHRIPAQT